MARRSFGCFSHCRRQRLCKSATLLSVCSSYVRSLKKPSIPCECTEGSCRVLSRELRTRLNEVNYPRLNGKEVSLEVGKNSRLCVCRMDSRMDQACCFLRCYRFLSDSLFIAFFVSLCLFNRTIRSTLRFCGFARLRLLESCECE